MASLVTPRIAVPIEELVKHHDFDPRGVERIATRRVKASVAVVEPDPRWAARYAETRARIVAALGGEEGTGRPVVVAVAHTGSTSLPGMPAKAVVDVDLTVRDVRDEAAYVPALERAGFRFLLREPAWHQHRFFCREGRGRVADDDDDDGEKEKGAAADDDDDDNFPVNLHVWGPGCPEVERHHIFREWLLRAPDDFALYARVKREAAAASARNGESVQDYNLRKEQTIRDILDRAYRDLGYLGGGGDGAAAQKDAEAEEDRVSGR
ncbi:GrpB domain-containingprotein [Purpureocillium lavendulum]|uniref:GrpB domain-containingprotein n=1 Tax=Purpureocillium lavendulum TaxID=1247861 RepID=A0AB34G6H7_9HYPO|nr:GrpB domain-containingprotein [Purpureocillium lavendulum]